MSDASVYSFEQQSLRLQAFAEHAWKDQAFNAWSPEARFDNVLFAASKLNFTTAASDASAKVVPDFILGADGKLRKNPDKKERNQDGSINIEIESGNKSEASAKKAANDLQRQWARDMIQRWQSSATHKGEDVPQEWLDLVGKQDDIPATPDKPQPAPIPEPAPSDIPGPPSGSGNNAPPPSGDSGGYATSGGGGTGGGGGGSDAGGGGGSYGGGGGYSGGGGGGDYSASRSSDGGSARPAGDSSITLQDVPGPVPPGQSLAHLQAAIERANNGGAPVKILQYGDSHVEGGVEPKAIEQSLRAVAPIDYQTKAQVGISANYPLEHPQEWLDQPLQSNPDVVMLSFGSNDSAGAVNKDQYEQNFQKLIDNVRQRAPNADIIIVGPSDGDSITGSNIGHTLPGLDNVVQAQKEVAAKNGLDFFDLRQSMGGPGSIEQWHAQGLAADDKLHFTQAGYEKIGGAIGDHIKNELKK